MGSDLIFTLRALRHAPRYSATVVGVIGVTLALATTVFAIVDGVLFRPLRYPDASRLVVVEPEFRTIPRPAAREGEVARYSASVIDLTNWQAAVPDVSFTAYRTGGKDCESPRRPSPSDSDPVPRPARRGGC